MARELKTVGENPGGDFEFYGGSEVKLGVLPAMPTEQFCDYATEALIRAFKATDAETAAQLGFTLGKLDAWMDKPRSTIHVDSRPESPYTTNPFNVLGNDVSTVIIFGDVKNGYIVRPQEFMNFVDYVFRGGKFGWDLMPSSVQTNAYLLRKAVLGE